jgi:hypothetical protein
MYSKVCTYIIWLELYLMLSASLFHILELAKMPGEIAQAIRSVAWLLGELEKETVAEATRSMVNKRVDLLNIETKSLLGEIQTTISEEVEKQMGSFNTVATKLLEEKGPRPISFCDMALKNVALLIGVDPRVLARKGIRARQFIVDISSDFPFKHLSQVELLKCFNGVMDRAGES